MISEIIHQSPKEHRHFEKNSLYKSDECDCIVICTQTLSANAKDDYFVGTILRNQADTTSVGNNGKFYKYSYRLWRGILQLTQS